MKEKYPDFKRANAYVVDKDKAVDSYIRYMLARTQAMFTYEGLPDTIPAKALEYLLQTQGYCFVTEHEGKLYALHGGLGGEPDVYGEPTQITIANTALKLSKTYDIETDGVLVENDALKIGLLPILEKYGALLAENTLTIRSVDVILRMVCLISAGDDKTHTSAEKFIRDIENGKLSAVGESPFFEGVKIHSVANTQNYLIQFIELEQYLKASCFNEIGLNANYNMKRENIGSNEAAMNDDFLLPLVDNMIKCREAAIAKINEKYGTNITIDYASAWRVTHAENQKEIAISESVSEGLENGTPVDIAVDQKKGVHDVSSPTISVEGINDDNGGRGTEETDTGTDGSADGGTSVSESSEGTDGDTETAVQDTGAESETRQVADGDSSSAETDDEKADDTNRG